VANFLLAWGNAEECGGFDLPDVWSDTGLALDMPRVLALVAERHQYPDNMGYGAQFETIVRAWRPPLVLTAGNE
jgi:hypothetical protein